MYQRFAAWFWNTYENALCLPVWPTLKLNESKILKWFFYFVTVQWANMFLTRMQNFSSIPSFLAKSRRKQWQFVNVARSPHRIYTNKETHWNLWARMHLMQFCRWWRSLPPFECWNVSILAQKLCCLPCRTLCGIWDSGFALYLSFWHGNWAHFEYQVDSIHSKWGKSHSQSHDIPHIVQQISQVS